MPNILMNVSWKEVTEGSKSVNSVDITMHPKHIFTITDTVHEVYKIP